MLANAATTTRTENKTKPKSDLEKHALKMQQFDAMEWKTAGYWRLVEKNAPEKKSKLKKSSYCSLFSLSWTPFSVFI